MQSRPLQLLYPHLNFSRVSSPPRSTLKLPTVEIPAPVVVTKPEVIVTKPEVIVEIIEKPLPERVKKSKPIKIDIDIQEESIPIVEPEVIQSPKNVKPKTSRPNRAKPLTKPITERVSQIPTKGERGLQARYTLAQKKEMYLERLSRRSIKNAEKEISKVNEVLDKVQYDSDMLAIEEKDLKGKLRLINTAKYFTTNNNIKNAKKTSTTQIDDIILCAKPLRSEVSSQSQSTEPIANGRGRGRGSDTETESEYSGSDCDT